MWLARPAAVERRHVCSLPALARRVCRGDRISTPLAELAVNQECTFEAPGDSRINPACPFEGMFDCSRSRLLGVGLELVASTRRNCSTNG